MNLKMRNWLVGALCAPFFMLAQVLELKNNSFLPRDKQQHFYVGGVVSGITYSVVSHATNDKDKAVWYGIGASLVVGLGKELIDRTDPDNRFDTGDMTVTLVGGAMFVKVISVFDGKRKRKRVANKR